MSPDTQVRMCDVVVVGGGIAGVCIAERLAREASRQGKVLKVLLVEARDELGTGASGSLEGWYHSGALYTKLADSDLNSRFLYNCINAVEDLYNWYCWDHKFPYRNNCNLVSIDEKQPRPDYQIARARSTRWFLDKILYLLPRTANARGEQSRGIDEAWQQTRLRVMSLIANAYFGVSWFNSDFKCCQAPESADIQLKDAEDLTFSGVLERSLRKPLELAAHALRKAQQEAHSPHLTPSALDAAKKAVEKAQKEYNLARRKALDEHQRATEKIGGVQRQLNLTNPKPIDVILSRDAVLNAYQVMSDLAASAESFGVEILTGYKLETNSIPISSYGDANTVTGLILNSTHDAERPRLHVVAKQFVFALGVGFDEADLHKKFDLRVKVEKKNSIIGVAGLVKNKARPKGPGLQACSFVRMDFERSKDFNYLYHSGGKSPFACFADSEALRDGATDEECAQSAAVLLQKGRDYFGQSIAPLLGWYTCVKTESPTVVGEDREYSYYFGPKWLERELASEKWKKQRSINQKDAKDAVKKWVISALEQEVREEPSPRVFVSERGDPGYLDGLVITEDTWAMKRAIHAALQQWVCKIQTAPSQAQKARDAFTHVCQLARSASDQLSRSDRKPNFLCIVPGKFSFFPTIAHQIYLEMEVRGLFGNLPEVHKGETPTPSRKANVALPRGEILLTKLRGSRAAPVKPD